MTYLYSSRDTSCPIWL